MIAPRQDSVSSEAKFLRPTSSKTVAQISIFGALIALGTIFSIPLPPPLYEITWAPALIMALGILSDSWVGFSATAIGSFIGEAYNVATRGGSPIFPLGIVWARAPEVLIIGWAKGKGTRMTVLAMVLATLYETVAFLIPDWLFYTFGLFGYGNPVDFAAGFSAAAPDVFTMVDIAFIPIAFAVIRGAAPIFRRTSMG